jgi:predicted nuclease with RNAse H fold
MEILESAAYIALGFIPTLGLLEIAYRLGMKIRRKRGIEGRVILPTTKSLLPIVFRK